MKNNTTCKVIEFNPGASERKEETEHNKRINDLQSHKQKMIDKLVETVPHVKINDEAMFFFQDVFAVMLATWHVEKCKMNISRLERQPLPAVPRPRQPRGR